ncbi:MAG TPA: choice-of-anchor Q domain-containing protein, partial [Polyangiaceae bacterium]|nr:choice-of-anchor Q domain-containing protein [Polyangiaceae bacterium]
GSYNAGMVTTVFDGFSSGVSGGTLDPGEVSMTNNLVILDGVRSFGDVIAAAITQANNLVIDTATQDPGVVNVAGTTAEDFDLVAGSPAIDAGQITPLTLLDYLNRTVPDASGVPDVGAFEYGSSVGAVRPDVPAPATGGASGTGGDTGAGETPAASGGATLTGGATGTGATANPASPGSEDESGCSCSVPTSPPGSPWLRCALALAIAILAGRRAARVRAP